MTKTICDKYIVVGCDLYKADIISQTDAEITVTISDNNQSVVLNRAEYELFDEYEYARLKQLANLRYYSFELSGRLGQVRNQIATIELESEMNQWTTIS